MKIGDKVKRRIAYQKGMWSCGDRILTVRKLAYQDVYFKEIEGSWDKNLFEVIGPACIRDRISQLEKEVEQLKKELSTEKEKATVGSKWKFTKYGPDKTSIYIVAQILDQYVLVNIDNGMCWTDKCKTIPEIFGTSYREYFEPA
jgi:hypothetical protein